MDSLPRIKSALFSILVEWPICAFAGEPDHRCQDVGRDGSFAVETGGLSSSTTETGNIINGVYDTSTNGTDSYAMTETGFDPSGNPFSQGITGADTYIETSQPRPFGAFSALICPFRQYSRTV